MSQTAKKGSGRHERELKGIGSAIIAIIRT
jgi:hypothetical protein